jgi:NACalpha-BTF3-like transcription factor
MKNKVIYESQVHIRDKSHDVLVIQEPKVNGVKLKMTYECYNAVERFTGELFVGGKWEHFFSILDLGIISDSSNYVRDELVRKKRSKQLQDLGIDFFNLIRN